MPDTLELIDESISLELFNTPAGAALLPTPTSDDGWVLVQRGGVVGWEPSVAPATEEDFTVSIDPGSGADPSGVELLRNQAEADARGAFASLPGALNALPSRLLHEVNPQWVDGQHTLTVDFLGDLSRFTYGITPTTGQTTGEIGRIRISSANGLVRVAGTPASMAVSGSAGTVITLDSDPGLVADAYVNRMAVVVSGTGSGQVIPITTHAGASFSVSRPPSTALDGTSRLEIQSAAAQMIIPSGIFPGWRAQFGADFTLPFPCLTFDAIDLVAPAGGLSIYPLNTSFAIDGGSRFLGLRMFAGNCGININTCAIDGRGEMLNAFFTSGPTSIRNNFGNPWLLRGYTDIPMVLIGGGNNGCGSGQAELFGGTIDGPGGVRAAIEANGRAAAIKCKTEILRGSGFLHGYRLRNGANATFTTALALDADRLTGTVDDLLMGEQGGVALSFVDIDADSEKAALGPQGVTVELQ